MKTKLEALAKYCRCPVCGKKFGSLTEIAFDHIARESSTHDNSVENCRPICEECHRLKTSGNGATSAGSDTHMAAKEKRIVRTGKMAVVKGRERPPGGKKKIPGRPFQKKPPKPSTQ